MSWQAQFWNRAVPLNGERIDPSTLWNMDETSVYLDMPPAKTLDLVGAKSVEIATTKHEYTRVAVVLCCNQTGMMLDPLVIHKCHKDTKNQNEVGRLFIQTDNGIDICMYVTKNESGMVEWYADAEVDTRHLYTSYATTRWTSRTAVLADGQLLGTHDS